jgi:hypothetical protein
MERSVMMDNCPRRCATLKVQSRLIEYAPAGTKEISYQAPCRASANYQLLANIITSPHITGGKKIDTLAKEKGSQ